MTIRLEDYDKALTRAAERARQWLGSLDDRRVAPTRGADAVLARVGGVLPREGRSPDDVVDLLADEAEAGLMAISSGRFFGWVMGGTLPAGLAADWLVSAWDQNTGLRYATPAAAAFEEAAAQWLLDLLGLPPTADVGFVTGGTMANFTGLAAARTHLLQRVGWDVNEHGLTGAPKVHLLVGAERHDTVDLALRYLGLGRPRAVPVDEQGRIRVDALTAALDQVPDGEPVIVCLQAGNIHSGAFDPFAPAIEIAHAHGAWVHIDGAFGLWAAASPHRRQLMAGAAGADSWATDAHKTLNVPYDCGVAVVADRSALRLTLAAHGDYLISDDAGPGDPHERVPELSRRARGIPVWAVLRSLGRDGVAELVDGLARQALALADGLRRIPGATVLNDVVFTQVCVAFENDERTREVTSRLIADGDTWMSGSRWHGRDVLRISVSSWATGDDDVQRALRDLTRAAAGSRSSARSPAATGTPSSAPRETGPSRRRPAGPAARRAGRATRPADPR